MSPLIGREIEETESCPSFALAKESAGVYIRSLWKWPTDGKETYVFGMGRESRLVYFFFSSIVLPGEFKCANCFEV